MNQDQKEFVEIGLIVGIVATVVVVLAVYWFIFTPSAADITEGSAWAEYTSDGNRHWVWRSNKLK